MNSSQQRELLLMLKALADKQRLTMVRLMSDTDRTVTEMAAILNLSEPTVSHHIAKLHEAGFMNLRMDGNQRFYRVNPRRFEQFRTLAAAVNTPLPAEEPYVSDTAWIDALDWPAEDKKVLRDYTDGGRITQFPTKEKKLLVLLRWLATKFEPGVRYSEKQVNAILKEVHLDTAQMRRDLFDYGFMRRERGGGDYWLAPENEA